MTCIAERAIAAAREAEEASRQAQQEESKRRLDRARSRIRDAYARLGIDWIGDAQQVGSRYVAEVRVDADAVLEVVLASHSSIMVTMTVVPAKDLFWNLPPDQDEIPHNAGRNNYGLGSVGTVSNLVELGRAILTVRAAREAWTEHWRTEGKLPA